MAVLEQNEAVWVEPNPHANHQGGYHPRQHGASVTDVCPCDDCPMRDYCGKARRVCQVFDAWAGRKSDSQKWHQWRYAERVPVRAL